ncbi:MAG: hypothetical protein ACRC1E_11090 [Craterilacuibacter sp.]
MPDNLPVLTEVVEPQVPLPTLHEAAEPAMDDDFGAALDLPPALLPDMASVILPADAPGSALFETLPSLDLGLAGEQEAEEEGALFSELDTPDNWPKTPLPLSPVDSLLEDFEFETGTIDYAPVEDVKPTVHAAALMSPADADVSPPPAVPAMPASWEADVPDLELDDLSLELDALFPSTPLAAVEPALPSASRWDGREGVTSRMPRTESLTTPEVEIEKGSPVQGMEADALAVPASARVTGLDAQLAGADALPVLAPSCDALMLDESEFVPASGVHTGADVCVPDAEIPVDEPPAIAHEPAFSQRSPESVTAELVPPALPAEPQPVVAPAMPHTVAVVDEAALLDAVCQRIMPRLKVELTLWLQDAIEVQSKQMLTGVMQQMKEDYDMLFGESLRESVRQAIADVGRKEQHKD